MPKKGNPTPEEQVAAAQSAEPLKMKAKLPHSNRMIVMAELTGKQEMASAVDAGDNDTAKGRMLYVWAQAMRSLVSIDGTPFDSSEHTPESFRAVFAAKDFGFVVELFMLVNRPTDADVATFREGAKATV